MGLLLRTPSRSSALDALIGRVFPPGCEVVPSQSVPPSQRFVVVPSGDGPRWILPMERTISRQIVRQWSPADPISRAKWRAALVAYRLNWIDRLPGTIAVGIANLNSSDWAGMGLTRSNSVVPTIFVARPSATRKAIVSLFCMDTHTVDCVVKVALEPSAWQFIERDYGNLQMVERLRAGLGPSPRGLFPHLGMSSQEWIRGEAAHRMPAESANDFLNMLWQTRGTTLVDLAARYRRRFDALPRIDGADRFGRMFDSIQCESRVPSAFYHGDFAMWNLFRQTDGSWRAFDWEFGDSDGAPLLDLFHFLLCSQLAAGRLNSFPAAVQITLDAHAVAIRSVLDKLGAPLQYAYDALVLSFIALYLTRFNSAFATERLHPQLHNVAMTFSAARSAARAMH